MAALLVNQDLCTRCGICSAVCPMSIVDPADENTLPMVQDANAGLCIRCGHCEVSCPSQALLLNYLPDEKATLPAGTGTISPEDLGVYLKKRRSVRHFTREPVPREKILQILDIARYASFGRQRPAGPVAYRSRSKGSPVACRPYHRLDEDVKRQRPPDERVYSLARCRMGSRG